MTRFLVPYAWPLIGALAFALIAAIGIIILQGAWLSEARSDRDALQERIDAINISRDIDNAIRRLDDDAFGADIDRRLSGDD